MEGGLDRYVIGIVELIIPRDVIDFVPYALQVIGTFYLFIKLF